jgi:type IV secretory pathway VirB10-like protein
METPDDLTPFMTGEHIDPPERLKAWLLYGVIGAVGFLVVLAMFLGVRSLTAPPVPPPQPVNDTPAMTAAVPPLEPTLKIPLTFAGLDRRPPEPKPDAPPIPQAEKLAEITPPAEEAPPPPPAQKEPAIRKEPAHQVQTVAQAPQKPERKPPNKWLFAEVQQGRGVQAPPFPLPKDEEESGPGGSRSRAASLFPQATWGTPEDPTKVLYRSQVINGILQHDVNSDQPGLIRILVTEEVQDRFGQGKTLLPQYTILLGAQDGKVSFGQSRLGVTIASAELPTGTVIAFNKFKAGDATGATGITGTVDNHYLQLGIGAVLSAALSIGSRAVAGNPRGFQQNLAQDFVEDVSRDVNRTGQEVVKRFADIPPTITIPHGTPVTVQLSENVNLMTAPAIIRK